MATFPFRLLSTLILIDLLYTIIIIDGVNGKILVAFGLQIFFISAFYILIILFQV